MDETLSNPLCIYCNNILNSDVLGIYYCSYCSCSFTIFEKNPICPICFAPYYLGDIPDALFSSTGLFHETLAFCSNPNCPSYRISKSPGSNIIFLSNNYKIVFYYNSNKDTISFHNDRHESILTINASEHSFLLKLIRII